jgi:hypothetical protein
VPISASAFDSTFLDDAGINNVLELQFFVPGLSVYNNQSAAQTNFNINGAITIPLIDGVAARACPAPVFCYPSRLLVVTSCSPTGSMTTKQPWTSTPLRRSNIGV